MIGWATTKPQASEKVQITSPDRDGLFDDLRQRMAAGRGFTLATLNLDHIVKLRQMPAFRKAYLGHTHVTADGHPIVWLSWLAGERISLIPGSELIVPVAEIAASERVPVALIGSTEATLTLAAERLKEQIPGLEVALTLAPPMGFDPTGPVADMTIASIRESGAGLCFLALGAPKQEELAAHAHAILPQVGFLSIGAGLDFIAGSQKRAPLILRKLAAEWVWRMASNPRRLSLRYAACLGVLPKLTLDALRARRQKV